MCASSIGLGTQDPQSSSLTEASTQVFRKQSLNSLPKAGGLLTPAPPYPSQTPNRKQVQGSTPQESITGSPCSPVSLSTHAHAHIHTHTRPRLLEVLSRRTCGVKRHGGVTHPAGNTHSAESARGGAPGGTAHGQILALFTVAAAFRATRRRHNLGQGEDRLPRESWARPAGGALASRSRVPLSPGEDRTWGLPVSWLRRVSRLCRVLSGYEGP